MKQSMKQPRHTPLDYQDVSTIQFSAISKQQIHSYSVMEIDQPFFYENGYPAKGGLLDLRLGISDGKQVCKTCGQSVQCPGHFGHINLQEPVYHYGYLAKVIQILKCVCHRCFRLKRSSDKQTRVKIKQVKRVADPEKKLKLMSNLLKSVKKCNKNNEEQDIFDKNFKPCGAVIPNMISLKNYKICYVNQSGKLCSYQREQIKRILYAFSYFTNECQALGFTKTKPIDLIIQALLVSPPQIRPYVLIGNQIKCEDDLSVHYLKILRINKQLKQKNISQNQRTDLVDMLQKLIGSLMVKVKPSTNNNYKAKQNLKKIKSISQRLKGKQGRFRNNLLGKRVDFTARSVISPDPYIDLNELGIPQKVAKQLTFPQKITALNIQKIQQLCLQHKVKFLINTPQSSLQNRQKIIEVSRISANCKEDYRPYIRYGMIAQRVLENGDYVLLNRQPTLHRMSMMAHKVRILPYNTFRINLSVCMPYNADFDGDQMNIHIPRSYEAVSQLKNIAAVQNQIIGPRNGTTSMGFSQDSLLGAYMITSKDTFLTRQQMLNLIIWVSDTYQNTFIDLPLPAILKPQPLWTGKQLINIIIPKQIHINSIKMKAKQQKYTSYNQTNLIITKGQYITGILQKQHIGASSSLHNIIHWIWMEKGPLRAQNFINSLQKIVYNWLMRIGFSVGVSDIVPTPQLTSQKELQSQKIYKLYNQTFNTFRNPHEINQKHLHQYGKKVLDSFQYNINLQLNNHLSKVQQNVKKTLNSSKNYIYKIIQAKSKGSQTNLAQILYSVGNQNINGQRCPLGFAKRSLPHFYKCDYSPLARGYIISSFFQGLKPAQFFFHSMAGRQGLSDTAIKTSHVGYLHKKLIKSLEDLVVKYDSSVRDSKNNMLQNLYGEDGFSAQFVQKHKLNAAQMKPNKFRQMFKWKEDQLKRIYRYSQKQINSIKKQYSQLHKSRRIFAKMNYANSDSLSLNFEYYCPITVERIINKIKYNNNSIQSNKIITPLQICEQVQKLLQNCILPPQKYLKQIRRLNQAENALKNIHTRQQYDSFSDQFQREDEDKEKQLIKKYNKKEKIEQKSQFKIFKIHLRFSLSSKVLCKIHNLTRQNFKILIKQISDYFFKSLAPAGEAVGCLASQSIGQPTTQMTLNTFHLAGVSDRNVTLGLPRLEQLLNCSKIIQNSKIVIFPKRPILQINSSKHQNRTYILDLLSFQFAQRKIQDFINTARYYFNPKMLQQKEKDLNMLPKGQKRTPWIIQLNFSSSKINCKKIWDQIVDKIERKATKIYQIDDIIDYTDDSNKSISPKVVIRIIESTSLIQKLILERKDHKISNLLNSIEKQIRETVICGIKGIKSVKLSKKRLNLSDQNERKQFVAFEAIGQNFKQCLSHHQINGNHTYSNNIQQVYSVLGIEAARESLINQFKQVLRPYGIYINYRHLSLLADWMCARGVLNSVNRYGVLQLKNISTFTKASFQQTANTLFKAAVFSHKDQVKDTSQKIIFGQSTQIGTSQCQLMIDTQKCSKFVYRLPEQQPKLTNQQFQFAKTPQYQNFQTNDNTLFDRKSQYNNSYILDPLSKSPAFMLSPLASFSPSYSPVPYQNKMVSPRYNIGKTDFTNRHVSPLYQRYINSPVYNNISMRQGRSPIPTNNFYKFQQVQKKQQDENQQTQRTLRLDQLPQSKNEDQF